MHNDIKKVIRKIIQSLGFVVFLLSPSSSQSLQLLKGLDYFGINVVLDIGANTGQFASELRSIGYRG
jgi:hypothetical protein